MVRLIEIPISDTRLYGDLAPIVQALRRKGIVVCKAATRERPCSVAPAGENTYCVGALRMTGDELVAYAARHGIIVSSG